MSRRDHWDHVYTTKSDADVSWFEASPEVSLRLLDAAGLSASSRVLDVGGGDSRLVDALLHRGVPDVTALDVSGAALARARARLGDRADTVTWIEADVTGDWMSAPVDFWHDRAVFHFLVDADDRDRYVAKLRETLRPGGTAVIATFALDGPTKCSGLPVARYSSETLAQTLGDAFVLDEASSHIHTTPWGATQAFQYARLRYEG